MECRAALRCDDAREAMVQQVFGAVGTFKHSRWKVHKTVMCFTLTAVEKRITVLRFQKNQHVSLLSPL